MSVSITVPSCSAYGHEVPPGFWDGLGLPALHPLDLITLETILLSQMWVFEKLLVVD